ncbi:hypothetical protein K466DRAFT_33574 [Polyporus arcularius HHB13444]|uniref:Uncharacterized protein n=1 Tax=Polyporus arcularius HHB13444 TaxID=1314778 RepID=A0A5C3NPE7_9APHY|nr:hypothetical protein K466DRAFT_33574 [Polyporus arcularius HHB13444]
MRRPPAWGVASPLVYRSLATPSLICTSAHSTTSLLSWFYQFAYRVQLHRVQAGPRGSARWVTTLREARVGSFAISSGCDLRF